MAQATNKGRTRNNTPKAAAKKSYAGDGFTVPKLYFNKPADDKVKIPRDGTLRGVAFRELKKGTTYAELYETCGDWYQKHPEKAPRSGKDLHRRVHELVKLIHSGNGFGLTTDDKGVIKVVEPKSKAAGKSA